MEQRGGRMYGLRTLVALVSWFTLAMCVTALVPSAGGLVLNPLSSARVVGRLRAGGGLRRRPCVPARPRMSSSGGGDPNSKKDVEAWQAVLAAARKRKESIKQDFFTFSQDKYGEIAASRADVFSARNRYTALKWVPAVGDLLNNTVADRRRDLEFLEGEMEMKRAESKAMLAMAEKEISEAEAKVEEAYQRVAVPTTVNQVGFKDPMLRADAEAAVGGAEAAYRGGRKEEAARLLREAQPIFDSLGVFPDSRAVSSSLAGRLYDLRKCIDTGAEYRTGASTGTEYITADKRIPSEVATKLQSQWSSQAQAGGLRLGAIRLPEDWEEWLDRPRVDPQFDQLLTALALVSTLGLFIFAVSAPPPPPPRCASARSVPR